jgi:hypothetical protein
MPLPAPCGDSCRARCAEPPQRRGKRAEDVQALPAEQLARGSRHSRFWKDCLSSANLATSANWQEHITQRPDDSTARRSSRQNHGEAMRTGQPIRTVMASPPTIHYSPRERPSLAPVSCDVPHHFDLFAVGEVREEIRSLRGILYQGAQANVLEKACEPA